MSIIIHVVLHNSEESDPRDYIQDTNRLLDEMNGPTMNQRQERDDKLKEKDEDK